MNRLDRKANKDLGGLGRERKATEKAGAAKVMADGVEVNQIKAGGHFGEMASWQMRGVDFPHP